jgi:hypothetical protein
MPEWFTFWIFNPELMTFEEAIGGFFLFMVAGFIYGKIVKK